MSICQCFRLPHVSIFKYVNKSQYISILLYVIMVICSYDKCHYVNMSIYEYVTMSRYQYLTLLICHYTNMSMNEKCQYLNILISHYINTQVCQFANISIYLYVNMLICKYKNMYVSQNISKCQYINES